MIVLHFRIYAHQHLHCVRICRLHMMMVQMRCRRRRQDVAFVASYMRRCCLWCHRYGSHIVCAARSSNVTRNIHRTWRFDTIAAVVDAAAVGGRRCFRYMCDHTIDAMQDERIVGRVWFHRFDEERSERGVDVTSLMLLGEQEKQETGT